MPATCRLSGQQLSVPIFKSLACAHCLFYIYFVTPPYSDTYFSTICPTGLLVCSLDDLKNCTCQDSPGKIFNVPEFSLNSSSSRPLEDLHTEPPLPSEFAFITLQCCEAAMRCCDQVLKSDSNVQEEVTLLHTTLGNVLLPHARPGQSVVPVTCPATWDGWQCFGRSEPGVISERCPNYIFGDKLRHDIDNGDTVKKKCLSTGDWFKVDRGEFSAEWTDYSGCVPSRAFSIKMVAGLIAFSITVLAIVPAIFIISLQAGLCQQLVFVIHKHLLYSFLFSGICYLFNCLFFVIDGAPGDHLYFMNHISCRLLFTAQLRYFRLSTFAWMLAEGVYLYRLLMCTFTTDSENFKPYFMLCWGIPLVITIAYSILRQNIDNDECWVSPSKEFWIEWTIIGPCLLALCINLLLIAVVLYVLIKKLRYNPHLEPMQYTKAVRAVFMLVPVFGLHFLFTIYRIPSFVHQVLNLVLDGIQGSVVALIVCYTNRTILEGLKKWVHTKLEQRKLRRQSKDVRSRFRRSLENNETAAEKHALIKNGLNSTTKKNTKQNEICMATTPPCNNNNNNNDTVKKKAIPPVRMASIDDDL